MRIGFLKCGFQKIQYLSGKTQFQVLCAKKSLFRKQAPKSLAKFGKNVMCCGSDVSSLLLGWEREGECDAQKELSRSIMLIHRDQTFRP
jgi:hypothetical protein